MRQFKCPLAWFKWRAMVMRVANLLFKTVLVTGVSNTEFYVVCYFLWCFLYLIVVTHTLYHSYDTDQGWSYSGLVRNNHGVFIGIKSLLWPWYVYTVSCRQNVVKAEWWLSSSSRLLENFQNIRNLGFKKQIAYCEFILFVRWTWHKN